MVTAVCTGGEAPPSSLCLAWLAGCQRTIAADGGLVHLRAAGRKADLWIGDGDSLPGARSDWSDWYDDECLLDRAKDDTDTEAAVRVALEGGPSEVWLLGGGGGRMDHWWSNLRLVSREPSITRWLTSHEEAWNLGAGPPLALKPGVVSIFPLGSGPWRIVSEGLKWPLSGVDFAQWHSMSNEAVEGASVSVEQGRFLVIRPLGIDHE